MPILSGVKVFLYLSPLDYRAIPEVAYDIDATIMFGTNTFLAGYARFAHPYDFHRVRYVFAGAERLEPETRRTWIEKFGLRILEGYGATETSPVLATNTAMEYRTGSVGRLLPGVEHYLEPVSGVERGGRLCVRGPNVMLGYLQPGTGKLRTAIDKAIEDDQAGRPEPPRTERGEGWYDTGDIVTINDDGFVTVEGRASRFAKVGGEMVSLAVIEELARRVWPDHRHAAVCRHEDRHQHQVRATPSSRPRWFNPTSRQEAERSATNRWPNSVAKACPERSASRSQRLRGPPRSHPVKIASRA